MQSRYISKKYLRITNFLAGMKAVSLIRDMVTCRCRKPHDQKTSQDLASNPDNHKYQEINFSKNNQEKFEDLGNMHKNFDDPIYEEIIYNDYANDNFNDQIYVVPVDLTYNDNEHIYAIPIYPT